MHHFSQGYSFLFIYRAPNSNNPEGPTPQAQTTSTEKLQPHKNLIQDPNLKNPNHHKGANLSEKWKE